MFPHLNFKKWSEPGVLCTFWSWNVLRAIAACNFSTSELQNVVQTCQIFSTLTWKCASPACNFSTSEFCFFPLWLKGNYSSLPQHLPQCFRDHSASFRDTHFTYIPSASFREQVFLVFASATTAPLRFQGFWQFLVVVGFISFHFGLLGLHFLSFWPFSFGTFVCLGLGHFLLFGHVFLPQCFREASARLPQNTEAKPVIKPTKRSDLATLHPKIKFQYSIWDMETKLHQDSQIHILPADPSLYPLPTSPSATFREGHPSAKLPRPEPCAFLIE